MKKYIHYHYLNIESIGKDHEKMSLFFLRESYPKVDCANFTG